LGRLKLDQSRRQSSETSVINFQAEFDAAKALAFELLQELIENKTRSNWKLAVSALNKSCVFILSAFGQLIVEISLNSREQVESHFEQLGANLLRLGSVLDKLGLEAKTLADEISAANGLSS
jgi:methylase of polypeptide subunit release factors